MSVGPNCTALAAPQRQNGTVAKKLLSRWTSSNIEATESLAVDTNQNANQRGQTPGC
jgi:hypothetical protein